MHARALGSPKTFVHNISTGITKTVCPSPVLWGCQLNRAEFDGLRIERSGAKINTRITQKQLGTVGSSRRRLIFCRCEQKGTREPATFQREEAACEAKERATSCTSTHYSTDRPVLLRDHKEKTTKHLLFDS